MAGRGRVYIQYIKEKKDGGTWKKQEKVDMIGNCGGVPVVVTS